MIKKKTALLSVVVIFTMLSASLVLLIPNNETSAADDDTVIKEVELTMTIVVGSRGTEPPITVPEGAKYSLAATGIKGTWGMLNNSAAGTGYLWQATIDGTMVLSEGLGAAASPYEFKADTVLRVNSIKVTADTGYTFATGVKVTTIVESVVTGEDGMTSTTSVIQDTTGETGWGASQLNCAFLVPIATTLLTSQTVSIGVPAYLPAGGTEADAKNMFIATSENYTIKSVVFTDRTGLTLDSIDQFVAGESYGAVLVLSPGERSWFKINGTGTPAFLNYDFAGGTWATQLNPDGNRFDFKVTWAHAFTAVDMVTTSDVTINGIPTAPEGKVSDVPIGANSSKYGATANWYLKGSDTPLAVNATFTAGSEYVLKVMMTPAAGYGISESAITSSNIDSKEMVNGSLLVTYKAMTATEVTEPANNNGNDNGSNTMIVAGAAIAIVAILALLYVFVLRK